jgi:hypothetical protein
MDSFQDILELTREYNKGNCTHLEYKNRLAFIITNLSNDGLGSLAGALDYYRRKLNSSAPSTSL